MDERNATLGLLIDLALIVRELAPPDAQRIIDRRLAKLEEVSRASGETLFLADHS